MQGWWITLEEAKERACGHEQWWVDSSSNTFFGCDRSKWKLCSPVDVLNNVKSNWKLDKKCVWLYSNKDMCIGDWGIGSKGEWVESGLGVKHNFNDPLKGKVEVGQWLNGYLNGSGKSYWLVSSPTWMSNSCGKSAIKLINNADKKKSRGIPFVHVGKFADGLMCDDVGAVAIIKSGESRVGRWSNGKTIDANGNVAKNWKKDHEVFGDL